MDTALVGVLLLGASIVLYVVGEMNRRLARQILGTEVTTVGELTALHAMVGDQVAAGLFTHRVGLQGTVRCDQPLLSDLTQTPCVAFRYRVEREWEEDYETRKPDGTRSRHTRRGSDPVAVNERRIPFQLQDATGSVLINPDGASMAMEQTAERFEPGSPDGVARSWPWPPSLDRPRERSHRRTLGYRFREEVLAIERSVYVLGTALDRSGTLTIAATMEPRGPFLISLKSREQVAQAARQTTMLTRYAAFACAPLGLILVLIGLLYRR